MVATLPAAIARSPKAIRARPGALGAAADAIAFLPDGAGTVADAPGTSTGAAASVRRAPGKRPDAIASIPAAPGTSPHVIAFIPKPVGIVPDALAPLPAHNSRTSAPRIDTDTKIVRPIFATRTMTPVRGAKPRRVAWAAPVVLNKRSHIMATENTQSIINRDNNRITGIKKNCMGQASILVGGVAYTPTEAIQVYQDDLDARAAVKAARVALTALLVKSSTAESTAAAFDSAFKLCIEGAYAHQPDTLDDFGIVVATRKVTTAATKAAAVAKAAATRALNQPSVPVASTPTAATAPATSVPTQVVNGGAVPTHP